jgi:hypothetical protein
MNTQLKPAQSEQETPTLNDLHRAYADACYSYGLIVVGSLDSGPSAAFATTHHRFCVVRTEKLAAIAQQSLDNALGNTTETPNYTTSQDVQRSPKNLTPTFAELHRIFAGVCHSYGVLDNDALNACNTISSLQLFALHTKKLDEITKQLLSNACGGAE